MGRIPIDVGAMIAAPNFAPEVWQTTRERPTGAGLWSKPPVTMSPDLARILALPTRKRPAGVTADAMVKLITERFRRDNPRCRCSDFNRECITELRLIQAWTLYELGLARGILGAIGVGHGKTILDLLAPLALPGCRLALLLVPPTLVSQLIADYQLVGQHFRMPSLIVHGSTWSAIQPGQPVLHVFPYSRLSRESATTFISQLKPDFIIADECQYLRNADTATMSRVLRYFAENPETRFAGWSGSITDASIEDYAHLSTMALREMSPLPNDPEVVKDWARAVDASEFPAPMGVLEMLCKPGEHVHAGFHRRLTGTLGVVSTTTSAITAELIIQERPAPKIPTDIAGHLSDVRNGVRPDGEELVTALDIHRCAREMACGFYYYWFFPNHEPSWLIEEWLEARKAWHKELRGKLQRRTEHMDSPMLCENAAKRAWKYVEDFDPALPLWKSETYPAWSKVKGLVKPETRTERVNDYLARDAATWALENRGIVWYSSGAFGQWVAELSGLPLHGGGPKAGETLALEKGDRSIIASIHSHGTGRDGLQRLFATQLISQPPSTSKMWEQMLGRLHRIGQGASVVRGWFYRHTPELRAHVDQALARALYVQGTLGASQKLRTGFVIPE